MIKVSVALSTGIFRPLIGRQVAAEGWSIDRDTRQLDRTGLSVRTDHSRSSGGTMRATYRGRLITKSSARGAAVKG